MNKIRYEGKSYDVDNIMDYGYLPMIEFDGMEVYVAANSESAGEAARLYWQELAEDDPEEFTCIVGKENLIYWALGKKSGPGTTQVRSLEEWLDLWLVIPEEQWASYDGNEIELILSKELAEELGFSDTKVVGYRHN